MERLREFLLWLSDKTSPNVVLCTLGLIVLSVVCAIWKLCALKIVFSFICLFALVVLFLLLCFGLGFFISIFIFPKKEELYKFLGFDKSFKKLYEENK